MASPAARRHAQTLAVANLLKTLPEQQLVDVLKEVGITYDMAAGVRRKARTCRTCGQVYPRCRAMWEGDHEFEPPLKPKTEEAP